MTSQAESEQLRKNRAKLKKIAQRLLKDCSVVVSVECCESVVLFLSIGRAAWFDRVPI